MPSSTNKVQIVVEVDGPAGRPAGEERIVVAGSAGTTASAGLGQVSANVTRLQSQFSALAQ